MKEVPKFPPHLLATIRKHRVSNAVLAAVLKCDRTTVSKKLNSHRNVSFSEIQSICEFFRKVKGISIDAAKVMKG